MTPGTELVPAEVDARTAEIERQAAQARAQAEALQVRDQGEYEQAAALVREIAARKKAAIAEHKKLKAPVLEAGRRIDQLKKDWLAPLDAADEVIRPKLQSYQDEQDRIRREEQARLEAERQERERLAREARERQEAEERAKRERAEREAREAAEEAARAKDEEDRKVAEALAEEAQLKAEEAAVAAEAIAALPDVQLPKAVVQSAPKAQGVSTRTVWRAEVVDATAVPREYLVVDEKAIRQAVRDGAREIPGVRIYEHTEMAVRS